MFRYLALIGGEVEGLRRCEFLQTPEWREVFRAERCSVFCAGDQYHLLADQGGVVVGTLFRRDVRPVRFDSTETHAILESRGRRLIESYWGRYVAFLTQPNCVVKDPTGRLPCFYAQHHGGAAFFSSLADFRALGLGPMSIDWAYVRQRVASGSGIIGRTGVTGVSEFLGGEHIGVSEAPARRTTLWQPREIIQSATLENADRAADELRVTVRSCTHAWTSRHENILQRLSGGFDSSLLLGCMDQRPVTCITYFDPESPSDERPWARLAALRAGCKHMEVARDPRLSFESLLAMQPLPCPPQDFAFLELGSLERRIAADHAVSAIITGDGGDAVFGSHSHRYAADDYLRRLGVNSNFIKVAADVAELNNISLWQVLLHAVHNSFFGAKSEDAVRLQHARRLVCHSPEKTHQHPWFDSGDLPPSALAVLAPVATSDLYYDPLFPADQPAPEYISPLLSQPVIELCLRIPSYVHFENGRDRGLARRAFTAEIPAEILNRQWKDRVQGFTESILIHGRKFAREFLLDGVLVKQRLLDAQKIETALLGRDPRGTVSVGEILDHLVVEAWLSAWTTNAS